MKAALAAAVGVAGVGIVVAFANVSGVRTPASPDSLRAVWAEVAWPFPIDQWGVGKAFVCGAADCGTDVSLTVRPKVGYCNCSTGVADDAELERVSDNDLLGAVPVARGRGRPIRVGWMTGLSRTYGTADSGAVTVAYNDECDVVVALATIGRGGASAVEPAVVAFLASRPMVLWAKKELGLEFVRRDW